LPDLKLEDLLLVTIYSCLSIIFMAPLHIWWPSQSTASGCTMFWRQGPT